MVQVLFVTWDGGGNVPPAVRLAEELRDRGDTVRFLGQARQRSYFESKGFEFEAVRGSETWDPIGPFTLPVAIARFARLITDRRFGADMLRIIRRQPVDVVVIDVLLFGALRAAHRAQLTRVVLVHTLLDFVTDATAPRSPLRIAARLRGYNPRHDIGRADLVLVASIAELERRRTSLASAALQHTGALLARPVVPEPDPGPEHGSEQQDTPLVVVSFSTSYMPGQADAYQRVLDALADLPVQVLVTTGPAVDGASLRPPDNATVRSYIPHTELLPRASVLVGHGGHATTLEALANDVPIVFLPQNPFADQVLIADRVQQWGAAIALDDTASTTTIAAAVTALLRRGSYRDNAARLGSAVRNAGGAPLAADLVEELAER